MMQQTCRPRRLRRNQAIRDVVAETWVQARNLMMPHFVVPGEGRRMQIESMPGIERQSIDQLARTVESELALGITQVLLFGVPGEESKDSNGLASTDVCLCGYTSHGHCGVLRDGEVDNDASLPILAKMARAHARAGADIVAPSDMMDGRVGAIRRGLDADGLASTALMSYSVKYASAYYGPFREAAPFGRRPLRRPGRATEEATR